VGKEAMQVTVQSKQKQLAEVPVVKVSDDMEQESLYLPQNGFVGRRKVAICIVKQQKGNMNINNL
jgi:hypothetical protein